MLRSARNTSDGADVGRIVQGMAVVTAQEETQQATCVSRMS